MATRPVLEMVVLPVENFNPGDQVKERTQVAQMGVILQVDGTLVQVRWYGGLASWRGSDELQKQEDFVTCPNCGGNHLPARF